MKDFKKVMMDKTNGHQEHHYLVYSIYLYNNKIDHHWATMI